MYIGYKSVLIVLGDVDLCISSKNAIVQVKMEGERSWKSFRNRVYKIEFINTLENVLNFSKSYLQYVHMKM